MWDRFGWNLVFWSMVGSWGWVIVGFPLVVDLCHESVVVVGMVGHMLYPSIRQCHCVGAFHIACNIFLMNLMINFELVPEPSATWPAL